MQFNCLASIFKGLKCEDLRIPSIYKVERPKTEDRADRKIPPVAGFREEPGCRETEVREGKADL